MPIGSPGYDLKYDFSNFCQAPPEISSFTSVVIGGSIADRDGRMPTAYGNSDVHSYMTIERVFDGRVFDSITAEQTGDVERQTWLINQPFYLSPPILGLDSRMHHTYNFIARIKRPDPNNPTQLVVVGERRFDGVEVNPSSTSSTVNLLHRDFPGVSIVVPAHRVNLNVPSYVATAPTPTPAMCSQSAPKRGSSQMLGTEGCTPVATTTPGGSLTTTPIRTPTPLRTLTPTPTTPHATPTAGPMPRPILRGGYINNQHQIWIDNYSQIYARGSAKYIVNPPDWQQPDCGSAIWPSDGTLEVVCNSVVRVRSFDANCNTSETGTYTATVGCPAPTPVPSAACSPDQCANCVINNSQTNVPEFFRFYQRSGWNTSCDMHDDIITNWCDMNDGNRNTCTSLRTGSCVSVCAP